MNNYTTLTRYKAATPRSARRQKGYTVPTISLPSGNSVSLGGVVMLSGEQTISSIKDFLAGIKIGGLSVYKSQNDTIYLDANLVVRGGITAFGTNETITASIFEALPIDGATLKRTKNGVLYVDTTVVGGGGISIADLEGYLTTNGYLTGITGKMVTDALGYTPLSTTGTAASAYLLKAIIGSSLVANTWNSSNGLSVSGWNTDGGWNTKYGTSLNISGFNTWHHRLGFNTNGVIEHWAAINTTTMRKVGDIAYVANIPTKLSQLTDDVFSGKVLALEIAKIGYGKANSWPLELFSTNSYTGIAFTCSDGTAHLRFMGGSKWGVTSAGWTATYDLLHSGNYSEYAVKKNLGINTAIADNEYGYGYVDGGWPETGPAMVFGAGNYKAGVHIGALGSAIRYGYTAGATSFTWRTILDDNNYSDYALPKDGTAVAANRLVEEVVTDLNNATAGRIFTMTSGYGSTAGNKPTEYWVTGLTLAYAQSSSFRRQLAFADAKDESLYLRAEHIGVWGEWSKILTSSNFYDYALPLTGGKINGDLEVAGCLYSSGENLRIRPRGASLAGVEIALSDADYWQISHRGSFANNELHFYHNANGTWSNSVLSLSANGDVVTGNNLLAKGGITATNSSDERLKRNIRKFNASEVLMSLGGIWEYEYIDSEVERNRIYEGTHYGLIYQHVKDTPLDVMCHEREDGFGTLNYIHPKFISLIAGATLENISEVEKLKRKIRHLEAKVKQLEQSA